MLDQSHGPGTSDKTELSDTVHHIAANYAKGAPCQRIMPEVFSHVWAVAGGCLHQRAIAS